MRMTEWRTLISLVHIAWDNYRRRRDRRWSTICASRCIHNEPDTTHTKIHVANAPSKLQLQPQFSVWGVYRCDLLQRQRRVLKEKGKKKEMCIYGDRTSWLLSCICSCADAQSRRQKTRYNLFIKVFALIYVTRLNGHLFRALCCLILHFDAVSAALVFSRFIPSNDRNQLVNYYYYYGAECACAVGSTTEAFVPIRCSQQNDDGSSCASRARTTTSNWFIRILHYNLVFFRQNRPQYLSLWSFSYIFETNIVILGSCR